MKLLPPKLSPPPQSEPSLYEQDETGWLEQMAQLIREGRFAEVDHEHLQEYLTDMARRDKREVLNRLITLLAHWLKWDCQPEQRSTSWQLTLAEQRRELVELLESRTLTNQARTVLDKAYRFAVEQAVIETKLPETAFPATNSRTLEEWLARADFAKPE